MNPLPSIDFSEIAARANLRSLVEAECGPPSRSRKYACPFHDDRNPSLSISPDGLRFKCWSSACGASGTALDWVMLRDRVDVVEAAKLLDPSIADESSPRSPRPPREKPAPKPEKASAWRDARWQGEADAIICRAEEALWSTEGRAALSWLRSRGLARETISRFRLGFLPRPMKSEPIEVLGPGDDGEIRRIYAPRGIVIPWLRPGSWHSPHPDPSGLDPSPRWVGANVRRLPADPFEELSKDMPKCQAFAGSERGHGFPWGEIQPSQGHRPALIVEGEIDALLGWQEAGWIVHTMTVGGASQGPHDSALSALAACPWWLIGTDHDEAGVEAACQWIERAPYKARRVTLPRGKDLGEFVQSGGNVLAWIKSELARLNIDPDA